MVMKYQMNFILSLIVIVIIARLNLTFSLNFNYPHLYDDIIKTFHCFILPNIHSLIPGINIPPDTLSKLLITNKFSI
jgi:hypothetical protein